MSSMDTRSTQKAQTFVNAWFAMHETVLPSVYSEGHWKMTTSILDPDGDSEDSLNLFNCSLYNFDHSWKYD